MGSKAKWEEFLSDAGIASKLANDYAHLFYSNRMQLDMLGDLNKELIHDLGINAIGDVINILRHAKKVASEMSRKRSKSPDADDVASFAKKSRDVPQPKLPAASIKTAENSSSSWSSEKEPKIAAKSSTKAATDSAPKVSSDLDKKPVKKALPAVRSVGKKSLSDRFVECEKASKRLTLEQERKDKEIQEKLKEAEKIIASAEVHAAGRAVQKKTEPVFTVSVSARHLADERHPVADEQPPITLVPARGAPLFRKKPSPTIFARLGSSGATVDNESKNARLHPGSEPRTRNQGATPSTVKQTVGLSLKRSAASASPAQSNQAPSHASHNDTIFCRLGNFGNKDNPRTVREKQIHVPSAEGLRPVKHVAPFRDQRVQQQQQQQQLGAGKASVFSRLSST